jgi:hypothetical protein
MLNRFPFPWTTIIDIDYADEFKVVAANGNTVWDTRYYPWTMLSDEEAQELVSWINERAESETSI